MEAPDTWIPALNALGIDDVNEVLAIRDRLRVPVRNKKCSIVSGISIVLRIMKYNVSRRDIFVAANASNHGLDKVKSMLSGIDALTGNDTSAHGFVRRINAIRENLARAGMDLPDHSPNILDAPKKDHDCTYCGAPGATVVHATSDHSNSYFCDQLCKHAYQGCSSLVYYTIPGRLRPRDKIWFVDLPLRMYNTFYNRNVDEATFVESVANMIRSSRFIHLADALFLGYYTATRAVCKDFIPHATYMTGHVDQHRIRHHVNKRVFRVSSCNRDDRATSLIVKGSRNLADSKIIDPGDVDKIKAAFVAIRCRIDSGASTTVAAAACYNIITSVIHKEVSVLDISRAFGVSYLRVHGCKIASRIRDVVLKPVMNP